MKIISSLKYHLRNYFGFSRAETNGLLLLLPIIVAFLFIKPIVRELYLNYSYSEFRNKFTQTELKLIFDIKDSLLIQEKKVLEITQPSNSENTHFPIYLPKVTKIQLKSWGIPENISQNLIKYQSAGGKINSADDLLKIYGMTDSLVNSILPFIQFEASNPKKVPAKQTIKFNLNTVDTLELQTIRGVGRVLSKRIVNFRNSLGGFIDQHQLYSVYHLDTLVAKRIIDNSYISKDFIPIRITLSIENIDQLASHPYISKKEAYILINYVKEHPNMVDFKEFYKIPAFDTLKIERITPYLLLK